MTPSTPCEKCGRWAWRKAIYVFICQVCDHRRLIR